jgi:hypothetical protein
MSRHPNRAIRKTPIIKRLNSNSTVSAQGGKCKYKEFSHLRMFLHSCTFPFSLSVTVSYLCTRNLKINLQSVAGNIFRCVDSVSRYMDKKAKSLTTLYLHLQEEIRLYLQCICKKILHQGRWVSIVSKLHLKNIGAPFQLPSAWLTDSLTD